MRKYWYRLVSWWKRRFPKPQSPTLDYLIVNESVKRAWVQEWKKPEEFISTRPPDSGSRFF